MKKTTFAVECPRCRAKVAAELEGSSGCGSVRLMFGYCMHCGTLLAGETHRLKVKGKAAKAAWSEIERIYPQPAQGRAGQRIAPFIAAALAEARESLHAPAPTAPDEQLGSALETLCRESLKRTASRRPLL